MTPGQDYDLHTIITELEAYWSSLFETVDSGRYDFADGQ